jgi:hypothetical protein
LSRNPSSPVQNRRGTSLRTLAGTLAPGIAEAAAPA